MLCLATLALFGCGKQHPVGLDLPSGALPGQAGPLLAMDVETVAADAPDPAELMTVLEGAGFAAGRQRTWTDPERARRAVVRVLGFGTPEGAASYLAWLRGHADDVIGTSRETTALELPSPSFLAVHEPSGCCPKETRTYLAAWREGTRVISIQVGGRHPRRRDAQELAAALDAAV